jgi:hypothetical protein
MHRELRDLHVALNASVRGGRAPARLLALAVPLAATAAVALVAGHLVNEFLLDRRVVQLYASAEHTAWTWAASMATLAAGLACGLLGFLGGRRMALALGGLLAFFALDDFVEVHERLGVEAADALSLPTWIGPRMWTLLYLPLLGLALVLGRRVLRDLERPVQRTVALGAALLATGVALEVVGIATKRAHEEGLGTPHEVRAGFEEAVELAGWILVAGGLTAGALAAAASSSPPAPAHRSTASGQ